MRITRLSDALGAEITGIDVGDPAGFSFDEVHDAFLRHQVLLLRDQHLTPETHIAFSRGFGEPEAHLVTDHLHPDYWEILLVSNKKENGEYIGAFSAGDHWHSDLSCNQRPTKVSLLYALEVPAVGGDTEWADMYAAYDTLPAATKERIKGLRGVHSFNRMRNPRVAMPEARRADAQRHYGDRSPEDAIHPMVRTHPETGRKALYVSQRFTLGIEGMDEAEARPLLDALFEHQTRRGLILRHRWRAGDLVIWDNRCTNHLACGGVPEGQLRHMHRTSIAGDVPR